MRILEMGDKSKRSFVFSCGYCGAKYATQPSDITGMSVLNGMLAKIHTNCPQCGIRNVMKITGNFFVQDEKTRFGSTYGIKTTDTEVEDE